MGSCSIVSFLPILLQLLLLPTATYGWGKDGHQLVGNLAYRLLSDNTRAAVQQILVNHPITTTSLLQSEKSTTTTTNTPLGDVADWADVVRYHKGYHWSAPLHFIDIHDEEVDGGCPVYDQTAQQQQACHFQYERDCSSNICVAGSIVNYTNHVADFYWKSATTTTTFNNRLRGSIALLAPYNYQQWRAQHSPFPTDDNNLVQESLMFLTHFVGDIHQPLHSGRETDKGGNTIPVTFEVPGNSSINTRHQQFYNPRSFHEHHHKLELHAVWDSSIILRAIHIEYDHNRDALEEVLLEYIHKAKTSGEIKEWLECPDTSDTTCTSKWAEESWQNALKWAYANAGEGQSEIKPGRHLTNEYYETRWPQIQHFLAVAGVRLAAALELVFQHGKSS